MFLFRKTKPQSANNDLRSEAERLVRALEFEASQRNIFNRTILDRRDDVDRQIAQASHALARLQDQPVKRGPTELERLQAKGEALGQSEPSLEPEIRKWQSELDRLNAEASELREEYDLAGREWQASSRLASRCRKFLDSVDWSNARNAAPARSKVRTVDEAREKLAALRKSLQEVNRSGPIREEAIAALRNRLDRLVSEATPIDAIARGESDLLLYSNPVGGFGIQEFRSLIFDLFRPEIEARLIEKVDQASDFKAGISAEDKKARIVTIEAEIFDVELREELLIREASIDGKIIARREDADPRAVLGIAP